MSLVVGLLAGAIVVILGARWRPRPIRLLPSIPTVNAHHRPRVDRRIVVIVGAISVAAVTGVIAGAAVCVVAAITPRFRRLRSQRRQIAAIAGAYPDFVDLFVLTIAAGCTPARSMQVLGGVAPACIRPSLECVEHGMTVGARFAEAVAELHRDPPVGLGVIAQPFADALALADRYGTPLAPVLERLADDARAQRRRNAEASARQLPIRLAFPLVGCTLPSFVLLTIVPLMAGTFSSLRGLTP
ncbi:MAG: gspF [Ilumatobacteraceae bacterium]|nr:gspF [Ilumatobacteraceae bacterium]